MTVDSVMYDLVFHRRFAYLPLRLTSGRWLWLRIYYRRLIYVTEYSIKFPMMVDTVKTQYEYFDEHEFLVMKLKGQDIRIAKP